MKTLKSLNTISALKFFPVFIYLILCSGSISAQVKLDFVQTFGDDVEISDNTYAVDADADGNIYTAGLFTGTIDFDESEDVHELTSSGNGDGFVLKTDSLGNFLWAINVGGINGDNAYSIKVSSDGSVYIGGWFMGDVDFDPGPEEFILSAGYQISYILKLDADGNFLWAVSTICTLWDIDIDADGNVVSTGKYVSTSDFDPGPSVHSLGGSGDNAYIQKLDADGNYVWAIGIGSANNESARSITADNDGNIIMHGEFWGTVDFNPGAGVFNLTSNGFSDYFVLKVDADGNFLWAVSYGNGAQESSWLALDADNEGNVIIGGTFWGTVDFNPGAGTANKTCAGTFDGYILKLDADGNFVWIKTITGGYTELVNLALDADDNIYSTGQFAISADFDPGPGIFTLYDHGGIQPDDTFIQKLDPDGNFVWATRIGGTGLEQGRCIVIDPAGSIIAGGSFTLTCDFDPGSQLNEITAGGVMGHYDGYVVRLSETICADLTIVIDSTSNPDCSISGFASAHGINGIEPYLYQWITEPITEDSIAYFLTEGYYNLIVTDSAACSKSTTILLTGPSTISDIDMTANLIYPGFSPGFSTTISVDAFNDGCAPTSGTIQLTFDLLLTYDESNPAPDIINGNTLTWNYDYAVFDSLHKTFDVIVTTSVDATLDDFIDLHVQVTSTGTDADTTNNYKDYHENVVGSFDPNDKQVYPAGACEEGFISHEQILTYTIRFQNTGTAEAHNIYILDTLNNRLNKNSARVIASSHAMHTEYLEGDVLKFVFNDIYLPDSNSNEPESHGYVIYEIGTKPSAPDGSVIENSAAIYFDFNDPVITNATSNKLIDIVPEADTVIQNFEICTGEFITVAGHAYTESGIYTDFLRSAAGCDSLIITTLTIFSPFYNSLADTICEGEEIIFDGDVFNASGIYVRNYETMFGCDSILTLELEVILQENTLIENTICEGEYIMIGDSIYTIAGEYIHIFESASGCDSTVTLDLDVIPNENVLMETTICEGESVTIGDSIYTTAGEYMNIFESTAGCDSIITLNLQVAENTNSFISEAICEGEIYLFGDIEISEPGIYTSVFTSSAGCDSTVELSLDVEELNINVLVSSTELIAEAADVTYQWVDCDNGYATIPGATDKIFTPSAGAEYAVIVSTADCADTSACYYFKPVSINALYRFNELRIYPNPASQTITITVSCIIKDAGITLKNVSGETIMQMEHINIMPVTLDISKIPSGFYILELTDEAHTGSIKLVKE
ncbi:MAG: T9SS type A sorting domain-containing protein [Fimbriimonadaceae bacterium]|nr:T9SS type A sorting domain-containing protein [Chitinophagales bacterium]